MHVLNPVGFGGGNAVTKTIGLLLVFLWNEFLPAQTGFTVPADSLEPAESAEGAIDQDLDDSPMLDILPADKSAGISDIGVSIRSRLSLVLERSRGFAQGLFLGSPVKSYQRMEFNGGRGFGGGVVLAKDPGEPHIDDFKSGYVRIENAGPLGRLVLGDYFIESGEGVALWRGFDYGKGGGVVSALKKSGRGIVPYRSSNENAFLRGAAAEFNLGRASITLFYSRRSLSGSADSMGSVSLYTSGVYRTLSQESLRDAVRENLAGFRGRVLFGDAGSAGLTYYGARFSEPLRLTAGSQNSGSRFSIASIDFHLNVLAAILTGEWALVAGVPGGVTSLFLYPSSRVVLIAALRHYPERFASPHGLGFGEHSSTSNEDGLYLGGRMGIADGISLGFYYDQFRFPGGSGGLPYPAGGHESFVQLRLRTERQCEVFVMYDRKSSESGDRAVTALGLTQTPTNVHLLERIRSNVEFDISDEIKVRARIEKAILHSALDGKLEQGAMLYENVAFQPVKRLTLNLRVVLFETASFAARMTELEDDLAGILAAPALSGEGARWYLLAKLKLAGDSELSAKYSRLMRDDVRRLGSGPDQLPAGEEDRFGAQLDLKF
jgi:hypothetical protein